MGAFESKECNTNCPPCDCPTYNLKCPGLEQYEPDRFPNYEKFSVETPGELCRKLVNDSAKPGGAGSKNFCDGAVAEGNCKNTCNSYYKEIGVHADYRGHDFAYVENLLKRR